MAATSDSELSPPGLVLVADFVNTRHGEDGSDALASPEGLAGWLRSHQAAPDAPLGESETELARRLREALRSLLLANNGEPIDPAAPRVIRDVSRGVLLRVGVGAGGGTSLEPAGGGLAGSFALLLIAVATAQVEGTWSRAKACPGCGLAFYDRSRNRSRVWCSMQTCGNRAKIRAYRHRRRAARPPAAGSPR